MKPEPQAFAVIPAAGIGRRMGTSVPKQYLTVHGRLVIEHTIDCLLTHSRIQAIIIAINSEDIWWPNTDYATNRYVYTVTGGKERCNSVLNALNLLNNLGLAKDDDWILVHDAVRPCLLHTDLDRLFATLKDTSIGGILGASVRDTMKRTTDNGIVISTVSRHNLWHAYTPQMFRFRLLQDALTLALQQKNIVTDEAEAIELSGHSPILVAGDMDNIKITRPKDLKLAEMILANRNTYNI